MGKRRDKVMLKGIAILVPRHGAKERLKASSRRRGATERVWIQSGRVQLVDVIYDYPFSQV
eukprot:4312893-Amphidinium_carterae.1